MNSLPLTGATDNGAAPDDWLTRALAEAQAERPVLLAAVWDALRAADCCRQTIRGKTRIVWWPRANIFPQRTDFVRRARGALPREHRTSKDLLASIRHLEGCTLPWAPPLETIDAADNAMFTEGDRYCINMPVWDRRPILIDVLHSAPPETTPAEIKKTMRERFQALAASSRVQALAPVMTAKACGFTYADFVNVGWTDAQLREHGYLA